MPLHTNYQVLLPFVNQRFTTFSGPSWFMSDDVQIRRISEDEARFFSENAPNGFPHSLDSEHKAAIISGLAEGPYNKVRGSHDAAISRFHLGIQTVFNLVTSEHPLSIPYGFTIGEARVKRLVKIYEFDVWTDTLTVSRGHYRFRGNIGTLEIVDLFRQLMSVLRRTEDINFALVRFSSSLLKINKNDKLIDLSIALESLVPGGGEFFFRFPFFLSLIAEQDFDGRKAVNSDLTTLYDARSSIVHGENRGSVRSAILIWERLVSHARQCLLYRIRFESKNLGIPWKDHLIDLAYGNAPNIWED